MTESNRARAEREVWEAMRAEKPSSPALERLWNLAVSLQEREIEADEILTYLLDVNECHLDHHGYCQEHGWLSDTTCPHARARTWLKKGTTDA